MNNNKPLNIKTRGIIFVLLAVLFWGVSFINTKVLLQEYSPVSIAIFRQFIAIIPLIIFLLVKKQFFKMSLRNVLHFSIAAFFGIVLYFVFENTGLMYTSASSASMIVATIPMFSLLVDTVLYKLKFDIKLMILIIISLIGVYFVISENGKINIFDSSFKGNMFVLFAMASWIVYTIISKELGKRYSSIQMTSIQTLLSIPLFMPFIIKDIPYWHLPSLTGLYNLIFLGVFCSAIAYVCFLYGIQTLGPSTASAYLNLIPVVTIIISAIFLKEVLTIYQIIGSILILSSLFAVSFYRGK